MHFKIIMFCSFDKTVMEAYTYLSPMATVLDLTDLTGCIIEVQVTEMTDDLHCVFIVGT